MQSVSIIASIPDKSNSKVATGNNAVDVDSPTVYEKATAGDGVSARIA